MAHSDAGDGWLFVAVCLTLGVGMYVAHLRQEAGGPDIFVAAATGGVRCMHGVATTSDVYRRVAQLPDTSLAPGAIVVAESAHGGFMMRHVAAVNQTHVELTSPMHGKAGCENQTIDRAATPLWEAKFMCRGFLCSLWCFFLNVVVLVV